MDRYHITKDGGEWKLRKEGNKIASKTASTKKEIIQEMQSFMKGKTGTVKIHNENGTIQEERTYQRKDDPKESKG
ncbi:DUF2188 domain-containing protein [Chimaeribacter arupi]|uniref:DUF2188 domain-containing protein n=1 Tax=Chimaeribacter arupi TaxID=2060066 RepID=UPI000C7A4A86|nr:DUF2188 domain-containing protein [Chimaeribacter arupi]PLR44901.1 hypothetical protein CYR52_17685 [Chimaeribacter arupi]